MSVFFIVVILLGVFFAMGYIVGRNSSPVTGPDVATRRSEPKSVTADVPASTRETANPVAAQGDRFTAGPRDSARASRPCRDCTREAVPARRELRPAGIRENLPAAFGDRPRRGRNHGRAAA